MPPTTSYRRGDVVLVPFPFTDLSATKQRPALVVSPDSLNSARDDVVLVAITSQVPARLEADEIEIPSAELNATGLLKPSIMKLSKIVTIHRDLVRKRIGCLPAPTLERVLAQIRANFQA